MAGLAGYDVGADVTLVEELTVASLPDKRNRSFDRLIEAGSEEERYVAALLDSRLHPLDAARFVPSAVAVDRLRSIDEARVLASLTAALRSESTPSHDPELIRLGAESLTLARLIARRPTPSPERPARLTRRNPNDDSLVVVVDARSLVDPAYANRGIGRVGWAVLTETARVCSGLRIVALDDSHGDLAPELPGVEFVDHLTEETIASCSVLLQLSPMTHPPLPILPLLFQGWVRKVAVIYDFMPAFRDDCSPRGLWSKIQYAQCVETLPYFDAMLSISDTTLEELRTLLGAHLSEGIQVARRVGAPDLVPMGSADKEPHRRNDVLNVALPIADNPRKNFICGVLSIVEYLRGGGVPIRLATYGDPTDLGIGEVLGRYASELSDRLQWKHLGRVMEGDLGRILAAADIVLLPSLAEGFDLNMAEAVRRGTPVVASDIGVHREYLGDGPWLFDCATPVDGARALREFVADGDSWWSLQDETLGDWADPAGFQRRVTESLEQILKDALHDCLPAGVGDSAVQSLLLVTPLHPEDSGVAEHSRLLVEHFLERIPVSTVPLTSLDGPRSRREVTLDIAQELATSPSRRPIYVMGNSDRHSGLLEALNLWPGPLLLHDPRATEMLVEAGHTQQVIEELRGRDSDFLPAHLHRFLVDGVTPLPPAFGAPLHHSPLLMTHGEAMAQWVADAVGAPVAAIPFVPPRNCASARHLVLGSGGNEHISLGAFGGIDPRTKGSELLISTLGWLHAWGIRATLTFIGGGDSEVRRSLIYAARQHGVVDDVSFTGSVNDAQFDSYLATIDVAVQLRLVPGPQVSGALASCIVTGVPSVATENLLQSIDAPSDYSVAVPGFPTGFLVAEAISELLDRRLTHASIEHSRLQYETLHNWHEYMAELIAALEGRPSNLVKPRGGQGVAIT